MTLWLGERLVVLEDLPARACRGCGETFYPPEIVARIERIQTGGAREAAPVRTLEVPVYSWEDL